MVDYTTLIKNNGTSDATGVIITDTLLAELEFVEAMRSENKNKCNKK
jgi:uncharacterized repeat protein (TIGR01451 family)